MTASSTNGTGFRTTFAQPGLLYDFRDNPLSTMVSAWNDSELCLGPSATHFGFVQDGSVAISSATHSFEISAGMYFSIPGEASVRGTGCGFVASRLDNHGFFHIGGPIEAAGRLQYIDGCTDSLLVAPVLWGDPCLNLLQVPSGTNQTAHTHPSLRVGMIVSGSGICRTGAGDTSLTTGLIFVIPADIVHSFHTRDQSLLIVAWHPDSDFGPTHEQHPMRNRTLVNGHRIVVGDEP